MIFRAKEQPKLSEGVKVIGTDVIRKIIAECSKDEKSEDCKLAWKDLGVEVV